MVLYWIGFLLIAAYAVYSWYWQATITVYARYRYSSIIWAFIFLVAIYYSNSIDVTSIATGPTIAAFIILSVVDGFGGLSNERIILSGYFKRALKFSELDKVVLIPSPDDTKKFVMAVFTTIKQQSFYMRFNKPIEDLVPLINSRTADHVVIEIQHFT